jgi:putative ABC transport system permease protein
MEKLLQDIRFGVRAFVRRPTFTLIAVLTLALGIGANSAIFSVVNGVLLRPLPYQDPQQLVVVWRDYQERGGPEREWWSYPNFVDTRDMSGTLQDLAVFAGWAPTLQTSEGAVRLTGGVVSHSYFSLLGVEPALGRLFTPAEDVPGNERFVLLGHGLWQQRFGADPHIIGRSLQLNGSAYTVGGVLPQGFEAPTLGDRDLGDQEIWSTMMLDPVNGRGSVTMRAIGRLRPEATLTQARADLSSVAGRLAETYPGPNTDVDMVVYPLRDEMVGNVSATLWVLLGVVGLVLLIACANVANLLLSRAASRQSEIAIRIAMGAGRARLIRQMLTESTMLSVAGGGVGLLVALWGVDLMTGVSPAAVPMPRLTEVGISGSVLLFTLAVALATGLLFGLVPALHAARVHINDVMKEGHSRASVRSSAGPTRGMLVIAEVALALTALTSAGLLLQSFHRLRHVDPGFNSENLLTFAVQLPPEWYEDGEALRSFERAANERFGAIAGVTASASVSTLPLGGDATDTGFRIVGEPEPEPGHGPVAWFRLVSSDYLPMIGIPLRSGRFIEERDQSGSPLVVAVNESFVDRYLGGGDAIGRRLRLSAELEAEIVGVVGNIRHFALDTEPPPAMYISNHQFPSRRLAFTLRTRGDPLSAAGAVRSALAELDPKLAPSRLQTMESLVNNSVAQERITSFLVMSFAAVALLLAAVGLYGVMSFTVAQRTHEIGVRMALGADAGSVVGLVVRQGMLLATAGIAIGVGGALGFTRLLRSILFGIGNGDIPTYLAVSVLLSLIALLATWVPARRASRVDPVVALRHE